MAIGLSSKVEVFGKFAELTRGANNRNFTQDEFSNIADFEGVSQDVLDEVFDATDLDGNGTITTHERDTMVRAYNTVVHDGFEAFTNNKAKYDTGDYANSLELSEMKSVLKDQNVLGNTAGNGFFRDTNNKNVLRNVFAIIDNSVDDLTDTGNGISRSEANAAKEALSYDTDAEMEQARRNEFLKPYNGAGKAIVSGGEVDQAISSSVFSEAEFIAAISDEDGNVDVDKLATLLYNMGIATSLSKAQTLAQTLIESQSGGDDTITAEELASNLNDLSSTSNKINHDDLIQGIFTTGTNVTNYKFNKEDLETFLDNSSKTAKKEWLSDMFKATIPSITPESAGEYANMMMADYPNNLEDALFGDNGNTQNLIQLKQNIMDYIVQNPEALETTSSSNDDVTEYSTFGKTSFVSALSEDGTASGAVDENALAQMLVDLGIASSLSDARELADALIENNGGETITAGELYTKLNALNKDRNIVDRQDFIDGIFKTGTSSSNYEYNHDAMTSFLNKADTTTRDTWLLNMLKEVGGVTNDTNARKYLSLFIEQNNGDEQSMEEFFFGNPAEDSIDHDTLSAKIQGFMRDNAQNVAGATPYVIR